MNNPFLKRLIKEKKEDVVHSSAYAQAQNEGKIGSASVESFAKRLSIDRNRQVVRRYGDSQIVNEAWGNAGMRAKKYEAPQKSPENQPISSLGNRGDNRVGNMREGMVPPARKNPGISR